MTRFKKTIAVTLVVSIFFVDTGIALATVPTWDVGLNGPPPQSTGTGGSSGGSAGGAIGSITSFLSRKEGWFGDKEERIGLGLDFSSFSSFASSVGSAASSVAGNLIPSWDSIAYYISRLVIQQLKQAVINWAQTGFNGAPSFIENPEQFFTDVADQASAIFIEELGQQIAGDPNFLCKDFSLMVRLSLNTSGANYNRRAGCTLNRVTENFENMSKHFENFENGGWQNFVQINQQQNNPSGVLILSVEARQQAIEKAFSNRMFAALAANGYHGSETCPPSQRRVSGCKNFQLKTPGKLVGDRVGQAVGSDFGGVMTSDELSELVQVLIDMAIYKVVQDLANGDND